MTNTYRIADPGASRTGQVRRFLASLLEREDIDAILAPSWLPMKNRVMPVLVAEPEDLESVDPLAPAFPLNAARLASRLTRKAPARKLVLVLRPCEIRALVELVKLHQADLEDILVIGLDCPGAYRNRDFAAAADSLGRELTDRFLASVAEGRAGAVEGWGIAPACKICRHPLPDGADIAIRLSASADPGELLVVGQTHAGTMLLSQLGLTPAGSEAKAPETWAAGRAEEREKVLAATKEATDSLEKLGRYLAECVNCLNCRVACPVCYCRECVFTTDVFDHEPRQYVQWARRRGRIKMPTDTVFYHLTRLAHMSTACVSCGQCSNACPNDIPVMELFAATAAATQAAFDYEAGRRLNEPPPLTVFRENELADVTAS